MAEIIITQAKTEVALVKNMGKMFDGTQFLVSQQWEGEITLKFVSRGDCTGLTREAIQGAISYALCSSSILI